MIDFGDVLKNLKANPDKSFRRSGWNGKGMWIKLQIPDINSKMGLPYLYLRTATGELVPWTISQTDALSDDWEEVS